MCGTKLGWFYEYANEEPQMYKEGQVILERALVQETEGFPTEKVSDDPQEPPALNPNAEFLQRAIPGKKRLYFTYLLLISFILYNSFLFILFAFFPCPTWNGHVRLLKNSTVVFFRFP